MLRLARAFTLIELLVVITIIVVLLALLAPALDIAVYQAQLATCGGAQVRGLGTAATVYASDHKRWYPHRTGHVGEPLLIRNPGATPPYDLRQTLKDYVPLKMYLDPLLGSLDLSDEANREDTLLYANYNFYFAWRITNWSGHRFMNRVGDRLVFQEPFVNETRIFNVLVSDRDAYLTGQWTMTSHPDHEDKLVKDTAQMSPSFTWTLSMSRWIRRGWTGTLRDNRGPIDNHYAHPDGSVKRLDSVMIGDSRVTTLPEQNNNSYPGNSAQLPPN